MKYERELKLQERQEQYRQQMIAQQRVSLSYPLPAWLLGISGLTISIGQSCRATCRSTAQPAAGDDECPAWTDSERIASLFGNSRSSQQHPEWDAQRIAQWDAAGRWRQSEPPSAARDAWTDQWVHGSSADVDEGDAPFRDAAESGGAASGNANADVSRQCADYPGSQPSARATADAAIPATAAATPAPPATPAAAAAVAAAPAPSATPAIADAGPTGATPIPQSAAICSPGIAFAELEHVECEQQPQHACHDGGSPGERGHAEPVVPPLDAAKRIHTFASHGPAEPVVERSGAADQQHPEPDPAQQSQHAPGTGDQAGYRPAAPIPAAAHVASGHECRRGQPGWGSGQLSDSARWELPILPARNQWWPGDASASRARILPDDARAPADAAKSGGRDEFSGHERCRPSIEPECDATNPTQWECSSWADAGVEQEPQSAQGPDCCGELSIAVANCKMLWDFVCSRLHPPLITLLLYIFVSLILLPFDSYTTFPFYLSSTYPFYPLLSLSHALLHLYLSCDGRIL